MITQTLTAFEASPRSMQGNSTLRLVIEVVTLTSGRIAYLVTRRGDLAVLYDAADMKDAQRYVATGQRTS